MTSPEVGRDALTVVVPSRNERDNVRTLVARLNAALAGRDADIFYVDDSTDDTPGVIEAAARTSQLPLRVMHREVAVGGLSGAVTEGIRLATGTYVVVMDGDLQHPAELVPVLADTASRESADLVVASRYAEGGGRRGLGSRWRRTVSRVSTALARGCFPRRIGRVCTDPMTGFFCVRRDAVNLDLLRPKGFKILLEILARHDLRVAEVPFAFGERWRGESKACWATGLQFLHQVASLRLGRGGRFAVVGAAGTLVNLAAMAALVHIARLNYGVAAVVATEIAILHNFVAQERFVFDDLHYDVSRRSRLLQSLAFNNLETVLRLPALVFLVSGLRVYSVAAQAMTLAVAFVARFLFVSRIVYRSGRSVPVPPIHGEESA